MYSKGTKVNSPTLLKLTTIKRDLSQCLQEEKRQSKPTKTTSNQFASSRSNNETNNSISFVPFEAYYVIIEDAEGLHCPIFKEYPVQFNKDESAAHFKIPRLPYPIFYWESPDGQCPFIPPPANEPQQPVRRSSQLNAIEKNPILNHPILQQQAPQQQQQQQDLRARALRNSTAAKQQQQPAINNAPKFVFEPAMTDTSILTAKTNLTRQQRHAMSQVQTHFATNPILKITPNFSVNVNRATVSATTLKQGNVNSNNFRKAKLGDETQSQQQQQQQQQQSVPQQQQHSAQLHGRKKEKNSAVTVAQRARPGFCECCCEKYSELDKHVREPMHRQFAIQTDNYEGIDSFINGLKRQFKSDYFYKSGNQHNSISNASIHNDNSLLMESSLVIQNSPISPTTTNSNTVVATARNYTGTKKMKQFMASKRVKMIANTTTSSILDEEEAEASGVVAVLSAATAQVEAVSTAVAEANYISSPSCKRRKSFKLVQ